MIKLTWIISYPFSNEVEDCSFLTLSWRWGDYTSLLSSLSYSKLSLLYRTIKKNTIGQPLVQVKPDLRSTIEHWTCCHMMLNILGLSSFGIKKNPLETTKWFARELEKTMFYEVHSFL